MIHTADKQVSQIKLKFVNIEQTIRQQVRQSLQDSANLIIQESKRVFLKNNSTDNTEFTNDFLFTAPTSDQINIGISAQNVVERELGTYKVNASPFLTPIVMQHETLFFNEVAKNIKSRIR